LRAATKCRRATFFRTRSQGDDAFVTAREQPMVLQIYLAGANTMEPQIRECC
jgi:hypothetical protein